MVMQMKAHTQIQSVLLLQPVENQETLLIVKLSEMHLNKLTSRWEQLEI